MKKRPYKSTTALVIAVSVMVFGTIFATNAPTLDTYAAARTVIGTVKGKAHTVKSAPTVRTLVNGKAYPAIEVGGDETYVKWTALDRLHTPYANEGNGIFAITGGTINGVVYRGSAYLPWNQLAPKVKATKLPGGGFNFTAVPVTHHYQIFIDSSNEPAIDMSTGSAGDNSPAPLMVAVLDGDNPVPNQSMTIKLTGGGFFSNYYNKNQIQVRSSIDGFDVYGTNDETPETIHPTVTWKAPDGKTLTESTSITFSSPKSAQASVPADESLAASTPITIYQDSVLLNVFSEGYRELFQLDTGAQIPLINKQVATELHLPNLGSTAVEGVTGVDQAYMSKITFTVGDKTFTNVPCMVDPNYSGTSLLGYHFFVQNGYDILVSQKHNTLSLLTAAAGSGASSGVTPSPSGTNTSPTSVTITPGTSSDGSSSSGVTVTSPSSDGNVGSSGSATNSSSPTSVIVTSGNGASGPTVSTTAYALNVAASAPSITIPAPQQVWKGYEGDVGSNPIIAGNVAVAADADSNGAIYAYDLNTGAKVWEHDEANNYQGVLAGSPATVLMTTPTGILALSASSGDPLWSQNVRPIADMQIVGNKAIVATASNVYVYDATTGKTVFSAASPWPIVKVTGNDNGMVFGTTTGKIVGISWSGQLQQQTQLTDSRITGLTADNNGGWLVTQGTTVTDVSSDGAERFADDFYASIEGGNVAVDGQEVVLATSGNTLYTLNAGNGSVIASSVMPLGASLYTPAASNGVIYEVTNNGYLALFHEATLKQQQSVSSYEYGMSEPLHCVATPLISSGTVVVQAHTPGYSGDAELVAFH